MPLKKVRAMAHCSVLGSQCTAFAVRASNIFSSLGAGCSGLPHGASFWVDRVRFLHLLCRSVCDRLLPRLMPQLSSSASLRGSTEGSMWCTRTSFCKRTKGDPHLDSFNRLALCPAVHSGGLPRALLTNFSDSWCSEAPVLHVFFCFF